jgi:hypothetical protein
MQGKPSGRPLGDLSNVYETKINTDETAAAATAHYGAIRHPTIDDIAVMIYDFWRAAKTRDPSVRWEDMRIWKMDLRGAYTQTEGHCDQSGQRRISGKRDPNRGPL